MTIKKCDKCGKPVVPKGAVGEGDVCKCPAQANDPLARGVVRADGEVKAAGTSEGAKKGWEERMRQMQSHIDENHADLRKSVDFSYPSSDNAERFGFKRGGYSVSFAKGNNPPVAMSMHETREAAMEHAGKHDKVKWSHSMIYIHPELKGEAAQATTASASNIVHSKESSADIESKPWVPGCPISFMWLPGGVSTITANFNNKAIELTVACDRETAAAVHASYEQMCVERGDMDPFGCIEHHEEEAAVRLPKGVGRFEWKDEPKPGVFCTAAPTELGARNVNGKMHRGWSPSFTTDAEYSKASETDGTLKFPDGARGSATNPAKITGVAFSVGSLTNKPAFRAILPVKSSEPEVVTAEEAGHKFHGNQWTGGEPTNPKIKALAEKMHADAQEFLVKEGYTPERHQRQYGTVTVKPGSKYTKVDLGDSGKLMVEHESGNIYGIKAYGVPHKGKHWGTLDTIQDYNWGEYYPVKEAPEKPKQTLEQALLNKGTEPLNPIAAVFARHEAAMKAIDALAAKQPMSERLWNEGKVTAGAPMGNKNAAGPHDMSGYDNAHLQRIATDPDATEETRTAARAEGLRRAGFKPDKSLTPRLRALAKMRSGRCRCR